MSDSSSLIGEWFGNPKRRKRSERRQAIPKPLVLSTKITPCFNKVCRITSRNNRSWARIRLRFPVDNDFWQGNVSALDSQVCDSGGLIGSQCRVEAATLGLTHKSFRSWQRASTQRTSQRKNFPQPRSTSQLGFCF